MSTAEQLAREVKNSLCTDGTLNSVLEAVLLSKSPDTTMALLTGLAHEAVDRAYRSTPADETWYCEAHPQHEMGHDGCGGAGIIESARVDMLANQLRLARQEIRECERFRDDVVQQAMARVAELSTPADGGGQGVTPLTEERVEFGLNCNLEDPSDEEAHAFAVGVRFAEQQHHIGLKPTTPKGMKGIADEYFARLAAERQSWIDQGKCPDCHGEGVIGGQFCGGTYEPCEACNGSGKPATKEGQS